MSDDESFPETATANEELHDLIQQWQRDGIDREILVVVAGKSGAGKSTLINNFLALGQDRAAATGLQPTSVTKEVKEYRGEVNGVRIRAIDMPGLHSQDHNEDTPAEIVATLIHLTNRKADILTYCIPLNQRLDMVDEKNIRTLNEAFSEKIWKSAIVAFTHADYILEEQIAGEANYDRVLSGFSGQVQVTLRQFGILARVSTSLHAVAHNEDANSSLRNRSDASVPQESSVDPEYIFTIIGVPTGKRPSKPPKWRQILLSQVINVCLKNIGSLIMELEGIQWKEVTALLRERALEAQFRARAHEYGDLLGAEVGVILAKILRVALSRSTTTVVGDIAAAGATITGLGIGVIGGRGVAALCILARGMTRPQNQARAEDIAFYVKVNKKLKDLRDGLQE